MSTRRGMWNGRTGNSARPSVGPASRRRRDSKVTVLAIELALANLGVCARLSDLVAKARSIENETVPSRFRGKPEHPC